MRTVTRRDLLRALATAGAFAAGGTVLTACTRDSDGGPKAEGQRVDVTLKIGGVPTANPYGLMPSEEQQRKDPNAKGYATALQAWLDNNPGVKLKHINMDTGDQQALVTALGGGTAPDIFIGNVVGGWGTGGIRSAMKQGLLADVTELVDEYEWDQKLNPVVKPAWDFWKVDGKRYCLPYEYSGTGQGLYYRLDFLQEAGFDQPAYDHTWTWEKVRQIAKATTKGKRKGIGLVNWNYWSPLGAEGHGLLTEIPAPDTKWNWRWDYTTNADAWIKVIELVRGMVYQDRSVMTDIAFQGNEIVDAFGRGDVGMWMGVNAGLTHSPTDPATTKFDAANKKKYEEVVRWIPVPFGSTGYFDGTARYGMAMISFRPDADATTLDKAVSLHTHMMGPGLTTQMKVIYEATKDLRAIYGGYVSGTMIPTNTTTPIFASTLEGLPGSVEEAWGKGIADCLKLGQDLPPTPMRELYFPAESNPAPPGTASDDALNRWAFQKKSPDLRADLVALEGTRNKTANGFKSSIEDDVFVEAAKKYYDAHDKTWREHAPEFHAQLFAPWYERTVKPALG